LIVRDLPPARFEDLAGWGRELCEGLGLWPDGLLCDFDAASLGLVARWSLLVFDTSARCARSLALSAGLDD
jgi:hypothetical protein